jgi:hypothetical protein
MWMECHGLTPTVQHRDRAHLSTQVSRIGSDIAQRFGSRAEQNGVDHPLVLERDLRRRYRQGEDEMKIRHRKQLRLPRFEPFGTRQALTLRAVTIAARVEGATN